MVDFRPFYTKEISNVASCSLSSAPIPFKKGSTLKERGTAGVGGRARWGEGGGEGSVCVLGGGGANIFLLE